MAEGDSLWHDPRAGSSEDGHPDPPHMTFLAALAHGPPFVSTNHDASAA